MSDNESLVPRVNFFDGQRVTEEDLDVEQIYNLSVTSSLVENFHGSGVLKRDFFDEKILLDTSFPNKHSEGSENLSKSAIESGNYDGMPISVDVQPSDQTHGSRLEVGLSDVEMRGRNYTSVFIIGRAFDGVGSPGELVSEVIHFKKNTKKITKFYYLRIFAVFFNNFSGGSGRVEGGQVADSLDLITESGGRAILKEAESLMVYPASKMIFQNESPNIFMSRFITYDEDKSLIDVMQEALGSEASFTDVYLDFQSDSVYLEKNASSSISYGQKFLAKSNNIQKIDILLSIKKDENRDIGSEYDFSGDIVVSVYKLSTDTKCPTDVVPDNLIDFDPEISPVVEISYSQQDLEELGYNLNGDPQVVSIDFSGTLIADPNIDPGIDPDSFYSFLISRRGDNRVGTIELQKGYDKPTRKKDLGIKLNIIEEYGKQESRFLEFDPDTSRYIDNKERSLWFEVHTDCVEVTSGVAYSDDGHKIVLPKTEDFVAGAEASLFVRNIPLKTVDSSEYNYISLMRQEEFNTPNVHPRTGNFVFTRIVDSVSISVLTASELESVLEDTKPILLARVLDRNVRDASDIEGAISLPGMIYRDHIWIMNPTSELLSENLINRIIVPDIDCQCASKYRIVGAECLRLMAADLDADGEISDQDILKVLELVGNTINAEETERKILGGEISGIDFVLSDLNADNTIDGFDIELMEDAIDGYVNFSVEEKINFLRLDLENVLESSDNPILFEDLSYSGSTASGTDTLSFTVDDERKALALRVGDKVEIPNSSLDAGVYLVLTKLVSDDGVSVEVTVSSEEGEEVSFIGSNSFNIAIVSGTYVNIFADNLDFVKIPYSSTNFAIYYVEAPFDEQFVEACDLRRFLSQSFIEEKEEECVCDEEECIEVDPCSPDYKNQIYVPSDIYLPNGEILSSPGVPYHGDIEYATVRMPLPPGSMEDCQVNLYETFVKSDEGSCKTAAGYPAMLYSDGTYVGCNDSGSDTDIAKGRVKFTSAIASLYVDALVEGYATDGISTDSESSYSATTISSSYINNTYNNFSGWSETPSLPSNITLSVSGNVEITSMTAPGVFEGGFMAPSGDSFDGDFILDTKAFRSVWQDSSLASGTIESYVDIEIQNDDLTSAKLQVGWRSNFLIERPIMFYRAIKFDSSGSLINVEEAEIRAPDELREEVLFRIRRVGEVCTAYYFLPETDSLVWNPTGQYIRLGENHSVHPGSGTCSLKIVSLQKGAPNAGLEFTTHWASTLIRSEYAAEDTDDPIVIGTIDSSTVEQSSGLFSMPLGITSRTSLQSAQLVLTLAEDIDLTDTTSDVFFVVPLDSVNIDNISTAHEYAWNQDFSYITAFVPGTASAGTTIEIDILNATKSMLLETGHLPGYEKGLWVLPAYSTTSSFEVEASARLDLEYVDTSTGVIFKVGISVDPATGIASFRTRNILYDSMIDENRTLVEFGVFLKKSTFRNDDISVGISDLNRIGIGSCADEEALLESGSECFFIVGSTATGTFVEGPFACSLHSPFVP